MSSHFDNFFRANYLSMVNYCESFWGSRADVEEVVADVIHKHYDEYREKITGPNPDKVLRRWLNRRALLDLKSRWAKETRWQTSEEVEVLTFDDPESLLELKQVLPPVHPILIEYEPFGKIGESEGKMGCPKGANSSADKTKFCRERKKFLEALRR